MEHSPYSTIPGDYQYRANYLGPVFQRFFHQQRRLLIDWLLAVKPGDHVLDAGCGSGVFAEYMHRQGAVVWGVDTHATAIDFASTALHADKLTFWNQPMHHITLPDHSIDKILVSEVMEHLTPTYLEAVAREFDRLLAPGGLILVTAPNYRSAWPLVEWLLDALRLVPTLHEQHITRTCTSYLRRCPFNSFAVLRMVGCFNYLAPFVALVSWRLAERVARLEMHAPLPGGLQVYGLWQKPHHPIQP